MRYLTICYCRDLTSHFHWSQQSKHRRFLLKLRYVRSQQRFESHSYRQRTRLKLAHFFLKCHLQISKSRVTKTKLPVRILSENINLRGPWSMMPEAIVWAIHRNDALVLHEVDVAEVWTFEGLALSHTYLRGRFQERFVYLLVLIAITFHFSFFQ